MDAALALTPDVIMEVLGTGSGQAGRDAKLLCDAIATDIVERREHRTAWIAPITVPTISWLAKTAVGPVKSGSILMDLLRLVKVASLSNADYIEALVHEC